MNINKTKVKNFVKDHKTAIFLGSIFMTGFVVGYRKGMNYEKAVSTVVRNLDSFEVYSLDHKYTPEIAAIYFGKKDNEHGVGYRLSHSEAINVINTLKDIIDKEK